MPPCQRGEPTHGLVLSSAPQGPNVYVESGGVLCIFDMATPTGISGSVTCPSELEVALICQPQACPCGRQCMQRLCVRLLPYALQWLLLASVGLVVLGVLAHLKRTHSFSRRTLFEAPLDEGVLHADQPWG